VTNTNFINSTAMGNGGAIYAVSRNLNISNSHFANNSAGSLGGAAAYCTEGQISIFNSSFHNNDANTGGDWLYYQRKGIAHS
jgi:predicted outer membrane repeat protein